MPSPLEERLRGWLAEDLADYTRMHMPFGKYGPRNFPPQGVVLCDLPLEYLAWFARRGFPRGRLGDLLRSLHQLKADGCDEIFDPIRRQRGGRTDLRGI